MLGLGPTVRSSRPEVFLWKGVLIICSKLTGEHPCQSAIATLLSSHFGMSVLLQICCILSEHLFLRTPLDGCFWTVKEITGKFMKKVKIKNGKAQVKKSGTWLKIYYFSKTFQRISLGLKQIVLLFIETGFINTILSKINLYIQ